MIKHSELIDLSVVKERKKLAESYRTNNVIYSRKGFKALGIVIRPEELLPETYRIIPFKKIKDITSEEIAISSDNDILLPYQIPEVYEAFSNPIKIIGFDIYNHNNNLIGVIKDIILQKSTGKIIAFIISEGIIDDLVEGYSILPVINYINFQEDHILISENQLSTISSQGGGLKKILGIE